jgi:hypothetical protein
LGDEVFIDERKIFKISSTTTTANAALSNNKNNNNKKNKQNLQKFIQLKLQFILPYPND